MKRIAVTFIGLILLTGIVYANHFTPAWWGQNPYLAMNFFVSGAEVHGTALQAGDEIGIFDGNTLVGAVLLTGPISSYPWQSVPINVSMTGGGVPASAIPGHFITIKVWKADTQTEYAYPEMSVFFDDASQAYFETQGDSFVHLISYSSPTGIGSQILTPPAGPGGGYVYNKSFPQAGVVIDQMWINAGGGGTVTAYSFDTPTLDCTFDGTAPPTNPNLGWFIDTQYISYYATTQYPATVSFMIAGLPGAENPENALLFRRNIHGTGAFTYVPAVYNPATGYLTAQVTALGEFVLMTDASIPPAPQYLTIQRITDGFRLDWSAVSGANNYKIYVSDEPYAGYRFLSATADTESGLGDAFLQANGVNPQQAFFRVTADSGR